MNLVKEPINVCGRIREKHYRNGNLVACHSADNLILNNAGTLLASLLATGNTDNILTSIGFGTGTAVATPADDSLTNPTVVDLVSADLSVAGQVTFTYQLGYAEGNGKVITERALQAFDGTLFSRVVRPAIQKESDLAIEGEWTIQFMGAA